MDINQTISLPLSETLTGHSDSATEATPPGAAVVGSYEYEARATPVMVTLRPTCWISGRKSLVLRTAMYRSQILARVQHRMRFPQVRYDLLRRMPLAAVVLPTRLGCRGRLRRNRPAPHYRCRRGLQSLSKARFAGPSV